MHKTSLLVIMVLLSCGRCSPSPLQALEVPMSPESVHLIYSYSAVNHKWPDAVRQSLISETKEKIRSLSKQPKGRTRTRVDRACLALYESRGKDAYETGRCAYWGSRRGWIWDNGRFAWAYNGKVVTASAAENVLSDPISHSQHQSLLRVMTKKAEVDIVPYLGFQQPAKQLTSAKNHSLKQTEDGWEESSYVPHLNVLIRPKAPIYAKVLLHYDKQGRLKSITKFVGDKLDVLYSRTQFSDYFATKGGFVCPHTVIQENCRRYANRGIEGSFPSRTTIYKLISADTAHIDEAMFSVEHPPLHITVEDYRYANEQHPGGIVYKYSNRNVTLDQASVAAARRDNKKQRQKRDWGLIAVRYVAFALMAVLLLNPAVQFVKGRKTREKE